MFSDDYKKELENIKPDGYIKQKTLKAIEEKSTQNKAPRISKWTLIYRITATAAAIALIVSGLGLLKHIKPKITVISSDFKSYGDVYKVIKEHKEYFDAFLDEDEAEGGLKGYDYLIGGAVDDVDKGSPPTSTGENTNANNISGNANKQDFTLTNNQVENVEEADAVKTDGEYIYYLWYGGLFKIIKAGNEPKLVSQTQIESEAPTENDKLNAKDSLLPYTEKASFNTEFYLAGDKAVFFEVCADSQLRGFTNAYIYDISDKSAPKLLYKTSQSGGYNTSRLIGNNLYLMTEYTVALNNVEEKKPETYIPYVENGGTDTLIAPECISIYGVKNSINYTVICGINLKDGNIVSNQAVLGDADILYCSSNNIIVADYMQNGMTPIVRYSLKDGVVKFECEGEIKGNLLNQFSIDEHNGYFRFVTTYTEKLEHKDNNYSSVRMENRNALYVLNDKLEKVGEVTDLAPDERVYSVRFMGNTAYFVTFRQTDPLFSVDLTDPTNPKVIGKLKIPGFSNYLFPFGEGKLLGIGKDADEETGMTNGLKISMFNISNPSNVTESQKFVLKGNYYYSNLSHKTVLVDYKNNLVGFSVYGRQGEEYRLYKLIEGVGFSQVLINQSKNFSHSSRGIRIDENLYIIGYDRIWVYSLKDFTPICDIKI